MRQPDLHKWEVKKETEGLLFFSLLVDELLFNYTIDSFKLPALNTRTICYELIHTIDQVEVGRIKEANIIPIIQELSGSMIKDPIITELFKGSVYSYIKELHKKQGSLSDIKSLILYLYNKIDKNYSEICKELLSQRIKDSLQKEDILRLTKNYINELITSGYSSAYIYFENERFFFTGKYPKVINSPDVINLYFKSFSAETKKYSVLFRASRQFIFINDIATSMNISVSEAAPSLKFPKESKNVDQILATNSRFPIYLTMKDIEAPDSLMARENAEEKMILVDSLIKYYIHRENLFWHENALIYTEDQSYFSVSDPPTPPTLKRPDERLENLNTLINNIMIAFDGRKVEQESRDRLIISLELHRSAIVSAILKNKVLNLWAAIEVLFPGKETGGTRIEQIVENLTPFIVKAYIAKLSAYLLKSINTCCREEGLKIIQKIEYGDNLIDKCTALCCIQENEPFRDELYKLLGNQPLLKNRIFYIHKEYSTTENILKNIKAHIERVSWHIMRIYRTRNLIIHSGEHLPFLNILVENLHSYIDRTLELIFKGLLNSKNPTTIGEVTIEHKLELEEHISLLEKARGENCTKDNYKKLLYGN